MAAELHVSRRLSPSGSSVNLSDVRLELPLLEAMVPLINGFDVRGGSRPAEVRWRWDKAQSTQDHAQRGLNCRVWLGSAAAGLQLNLQGGGEAAAAVASSCGNDEDGRLQCGDVSDAQFNAALGSREWYNSNRGGATVLLDTTGDHPPAVRLSVHTGELPPLRPGERLRLHWRLLLTPVRGAGGPVRADFATRYFHMQRHIDLGEALDTSPTRPWIILHQGNPLIPYINYPFIDLQPLRQYVRDAHAAGAKVKLYYTVRELSSRAVELWALRALGSEVLISSRGKAAGHAWLREHLRANYTAAWHEVLTDGEVDAAVQTPAFTSRWDNYWIEGILWLVRNIGIDGIYLDGAPYERTVLRRLRRALAAERRGRRGDPFLLDLHASCAGNPHLPYMELYPYLDSIWFGEQCEYRTFSPPMWLAEVSGVPFGLGSELLGDNSDQWQGLVHGMTCRIYPDPWKCNPRPLWAALDAMGMLRPRLLGWWDSACPVSLLAPTVEYGHGGGSGPAAVASVFIGDGAAESPPRFAVAVANWADHPVEVRIRANYSALAALGLRSERKLRLRAREIDGFQSEAHWALGDAIRLEEKGGGVDQGLLLSIL